MYYTQSFEDSLHYITEEKTKKISFYVYFCLCNRIEEVNFFWFILFPLILYTIHAVVHSFYVHIVNFVDIVVVVLQLDTICIFNGEKWYWNKKKNCKTKLKYRQKCIKIINCSRQYLKSLCLTNCTIFIENTITWHHPFHLWKLKVNRLKAFLWKLYENYFFPDSSPLSKHPLFALCYPLFNIFL